MGRCLVLLMLGLGIATAHTHVSCPTDSALKGRKSKAALEVLERLKGTIAMSGDNVCSGALVTFAGRSSSAAALVLSAAHCVRGNGSLGALDDKEVLYHFEYRRPLTLDTGNSETPRTCVETDQIVYATMTGADVLLLRLTESYDQLERRAGVKPFVVSRVTSFSSGLPVRMPSSYWQNDRACQVETTVEQVKEFRWTWSPVLRLRVDRNCGIPGGASGSPLVQQQTNEVIGVAGTAGNGDRRRACELNNPCEINVDGSTTAATRGQPYIHFVHRFYTCLDSARDIDLGTQECLLPRP
jgi:hypothetical protein